ncbi:MAG: MlaD family protein [Burkholderiaceae bacterium]
MENKAHALAAGIFLLAMTALLVLLVSWLSSSSAAQNSYQISTRESISGLQPQAPVRLRGVAVGKVAAIGFDAAAPGNVLIALEIDPAAPITQDTFAMLGLQGVTGLAYVQLDDKLAAGGQSAPRLVPNNAAPPRIPMQPSLLDKLAARSEVILLQTEQVTQRLNQLLAEPNQQRLASALDNVGQAAVSVSQMSTQFAAIMNAQLGPDRMNLPAFVSNADAAVVSLKATSGLAQTALAELGETARRLNAKDGALERLTDGTQALSQAAQAFNATTLPRLNRVTDDASRAVRQLSRTVNGINDNPQSLIFGSGEVNPGPGEPGFTPPKAP